MSLFTVTENDRRIYEEQLRDYLPDQIIDVHAHVWKGAPKPNPNAPKRIVSWPSLVAAENTIEDIQEAYKLYFPDKKVTPLIYADRISDIESCHARNAYIAESVKATGFPALYYSHPLQTADELEREIYRHGFLGIKSYLSLSPSYIPEGEIRILDFFPPHQLELMNKLGLMVMLHIPRHARLRDPVNLAQILHICERYPNLRLVIAHVGRAYCKCDIGDAFEQLKDYKDLYYDITANTSAYVFEQLLTNVSEDRILFGSDEPIVRMRMHRIEENNTYINLIPPGLYGDPSQDPHLREVSEEEGRKLTFFMYEEILAMKEATTRLGLGKETVNKLFYLNSRRLLDELESKVRA